MEWTIPGTVLKIRRQDADGVQAQLEAMFLAGGITLSQVTGVTGLEPHTVQNWVKRGFLSPPQKKRYSLQQLCRILNINLLRGALMLEQVCSLLTYINGALDKEDDDIIDDAALYFLFVRLAARAKQLDDPAAWEKAMADALADYCEPVPGAKERIEKALRIMLTAWISSTMRQNAEKMLKEL